MNTHTPTLYPSLSFSFSLSIPNETVYRTCTQCVSYTPDKRRRIYLFFCSLSNILFFVHLVYYSMIVKSRLTNEMKSLSYTNEWDGNKTKHARNLLPIFVDVRKFELQLPPDGHDGNSIKKVSIVLRVVDQTACVVKQRSPLLINCQMWTRCPQGGWANRKKNERKSTRKMYILIE